MEEKKYALPIPRGVTTGIVFEAAEKFGLQVDQEKANPDDAFDPHTGFPIRDFVPRMILIGDSPEKLLAAKEYIDKKHEEWIEHLEEWRTRRRMQILGKSK